MQILARIVKTIAGILSGITAVAIIVMIFYGGYKVGIAVTDWLLRLF